MVETLTRLVVELGPWGLVLLAAAACIEYLFPPFPGDTITVFGAWLAIQGSLPPLAVWAMVTAGSVLGMAIDWRIGVRLNQQVYTLPDESARRWWQLVSRERLDRFEDAYRRWGGWLIVANRFIPAVRAFFFVAAGASGMSLARTLVLGVISAAVWNGLLIFVGGALEMGLESLGEVTRTYSQWALGALVVVGLIAGVVGWLRSRRTSTPRGEHSGPSADPPGP